MFASVDESVVGKFRGKVFFLRNSNKLRVLTHSPPFYGTHSAKTTFLYVIIFLYKVAESHVPPLYLLLDISVYTSIFGSVQEE